MKIFSFKNVVPALGIEGNTKLSLFKNKGQLDSQGTFDDVGIDN